MLIYKYIFLLFVYLKHFIRGRSFLIPRRGAEWKCRKPRKFSHPLENPEKKFAPPQKFPKKNHTPSRKFQKKIHTPSNFILQNALQRIYKHRAFFQIIFGAIFLFSKHFWGHHLLSKHSSYFSIFLWACIIKIANFRFSISYKKKLAISSKRLNIWKS